MTGSRWIVPALAWLALCVAGCGGDGDQPADGSAAKETQRVATDEAKSPVAEGKGETTESPATLERVAPAGEELPVPAPLVTPTNKGEFLAAVRQGNAAAVRAGLESHAEWAAAASDLGETALELAVGTGQAEMVAALIAAGADVKVHPKTGGTLLHLAAKADPADVARMLLDAGLDAAAVDATGNTPLHVAAGAGAREVVALLLERGAEVGAVNAAEETPLHLSAGTEMTSVARKLLEAGADANAKTADGRTPLSIARAQKNEWMTNLLRQHSAKE